MPPLVRVEISSDGMEVYPAALQPNLRFTYGLFNGGKVTRLGPVTFDYGINGGIRRIGYLTVEYGWNGHVREVSGRDDRVEVTIDTRPHSRQSDNRDSRKSNRS